MRKRGRNIVCCYNWKVRNELPAHATHSSLHLSFFIFFLFLFCLPASAYTGENAGMPDASILGTSILIPIFLLLIVCLLVIIAGLVVHIRHQKRRFRRCQEYLVRYITNNMELKKQVSGSKEPYDFYPPDVTPEEFTKIINTMLKRIMFLLLFVLLALPLAAQETAHAATGATSLRVDLLRWATLTPDLGVEWRNDNRGNTI